MLSCGHVFCRTCAVKLLLPHREHTHERTHTLTSLQQAATAQSTPTAITEQDGGDILTEDSTDLINSTDSTALEISYVCEVCPICAAFSPPGGEGLEKNATANSASTATARVSTSSVLAQYYPSTSSVLTQY